MQIHDVEKIALAEGEVLVIRIPIGTMPMGLWRARAEETRNAFSTLLLTNNIVVVPTDYTFAKISKEQKEVICTR